MSADLQLSSTLPPTRSDSALLTTSSTTNEMGKPYEHRRTAHLKLLVSNSLRQHLVQEHFYHSLDGRFLST